MTANTQKKPQVNAKSSNICTGFTAHPEDTQVPVVVKFNNSAFVDSTDTKLSLDGRN